MSSDDIVEFFIYVALRSKGAIEHKVLVQLTGAILNEHLAAQLKSSRYFVERVRLTKEANDVDFI
ncbi:hypothetical protein ABE288_07095 [Bacillus salipaludis]|uniref:hypothetical protein n=1 Tax=Bacillus salipaludis TaxID=2547811 RepID=UPI003D1D54F1